MREKILEILEKYTIGERELVVYKIMEVLEEKEPPSWEKRFDEKLNGYIREVECSAKNEYRVEDAEPIKDFIRDLLEEKDKEIEKLQKVVEAADKVVKWLKAGNFEQSQEGRALFRTLKELKGE